jgi:hypothetical protein
MYPKRWPKLLLLFIIYLYEFVHNTSYNFQKALAVTVFTGERSSSLSFSLMNMITTYTVHYNIIIIIKYSGERE